VWRVSHAGRRRCARSRSNAETQEDEEFMTRPRCLSCSDDRRVRYVPAVILSVYSPPTPRQLVVEVADPAAPSATAFRTP
jgi:hypothetical protein